MTDSMFTALGKQTLADLERGATALALWRKWLRGFEGAPWVLFEYEAARPVCSMCWHPYPEHGDECFYAAAAALFPGEYTDDH